MKINYGTREELRRMVEEQLKEIPQGQRIHLDVSILEELLFEKEMLRGNVGKIPVWTGEFLRKIDLSEVSFEGVCWYAENYLELEKSIKYRNKIDNIDFSYTNANIDFSKAFEAVVYQNDNDDDSFNRPNVNVMSCNFEGTDLSNNDLSSVIVCFYNSNIVGTNLNFKNVNYEIVTYGTNFSGLDLSWLTVDLKDFVGEKTNFQIFGSNFSNTGLRMSGDIKDLDEVEREILSTSIKEGRLEGCYINGILIKPMKSMEEIQQVKENNELIRTIMQSIENQKNSFKK